MGSGSRTRDCRSTWPSVPMRLGARSRDLHPTGRLPDSVSQFYLYDVEDTLANQREILDTDVRRSSRVEMTVFDLTTSGSRQPRFYRWWPPWPPCYGMQRAVRINSIQKLHEGVRGQQTTDAITTAPALAGRSGTRINRVLAYEILHS
ncbi:hypothetical protein F444_13184 [Phytophthora nicotianae P1976]|uniref:Uncharacterized protein n=1 Tax=Phytophthora nicotianae P1976 TaxID=1317066 RepID=A0A080ZUL7_PHYNI|nr:hypothetical protein F444_13184 [Phytophthora nicotianae P1976]